MILKPLFFPIFIISTAPAGIIKLNPTNVIKHANKKIATFVLIFILYSPNGYFHFFHFTYINVYRCQKVVFL